MAEITASSMREAARLAGVTAPTVRHWIHKGWLPAGGPWTPGQLVDAAARSSQGGNRGPRAPHGSLTRFRAGCLCEECQAAHNAALLETRRATRTARLAPHRQALLDAMTSGASPAEAAKGAGLQVQALYGWARWGPEWSRDMNDALMIGRRPDLDHGTSTVALQCHCPECRVVRQH